jgi:hypothetical protein
MKGFSAQWHRCADFPSFFLHFERMEKEKTVRRST